SAQHDHARGRLAGRRIFRSKRPYPKVSPLDCRSAVWKEPKRTFRAPDRPGGSIGVALSAKPGARFVTSGRRGRKAEGVDTGRKGHLVADTVPHSCANRKWHGRFRPHHPCALRFKQVAPGEVGPGAAARVEDGKSRRRPPRFDAKRRIRRLVTDEEITEP